MNHLTVFDIADGFLAMEAMTHKKLQKMCYYAYSWHLTLYNKHLFPQPFEAWIHGPVQPQLYQKYKHTGWQPIPRQAKPPHTFSREIQDFLQQVFASYGHLSGDELEYLTHTERPWLEARGRLPEYVPCTNIIRVEVIRNFYLEIFEKGQND